MELSFDDDQDEIRIRLTGGVRWNDRLRLGALAGALSRSRSPRLVLDASLASEADAGSFQGLAATARRLCALAGRTAIVLPPAGAA